jgi:PEP-CTERM motif-containing protein
VRLALLRAGIFLTAALFAFASEQAHAVPDFRDGWVDQGGKYHPFPPRIGSGDTSQPSDGLSDGPHGGTHDSDSYANDQSAGIRDSTSGDTGPSGGTSDTGLSALNTIIGDLPLDNGTLGGTERGSDGGAHGGTGGTQSGDSGGSSVTPGGSRLAVPEPATIALLGGALVAAGAANRRRQKK